MKLLKATASPLSCLAALSLSASAQTSTGGVNGTISDPNGAAVPGSTVTLVNKSTNIEAHASTNESGNFTFVNLNPGTYVLKVEAQGFSTAQTPPFDVGVSQVVTQNIALSVGAVSQTVEVVAGSELMQASSSELGTVISEKTIQDLPLNGRNFTQLLTLTPGVTPVSTSRNRSIGGVEGNVGIPGSGFADPAFPGQNNRSKLYKKEKSVCPTRVAAS